MLKKTLLLSAVASLALIANATKVLAWGGGRSFSGAGAYGGSYSHTSATVGNYGSYAHAGTSSYTTPSGETYSGAHAGYGNYGYGAATYHGAYAGTTPYGSYAGTGSYYGYHGAAYPSYYTGGYYGCGWGSSYVAPTTIVTPAAPVPAPIPVASIPVAPIATVAPATTYSYPSSGVYVAPGTPLPSEVPANNASLPIGTTVSILPLGFNSISVGNQAYYTCGNTWFRPYLASNGSYMYIVVAAPQ